jgi:hypothetical protein
MVRFLIGFIGLAVVGACGCGGGAVSGGAASDAPPADAVPDVGADPDSVDGALLPDVTASDAGDLEGPAIDVLFPTEDATVSGVVTVHVVAEDPSGVTSLEVVVQGEALGDDIGRRRTLQGRRASRRRPR